MGKRLLQIHRGGKGKWKIRKEFTWIYMLFKPCHQVVSIEMIQAVPKRLFMVALEELEFLLKAGKEPCA